MRRIHSTLAALTILLALTPWTRGEAFDPKQVPADAKWLLHIDMDAIRGSKIWELIRDKIAQNENFQGKIEELQAATGLKFPDDLHGVTLFGPSFDEKSALVLIDCTVDQGKVIGLLQLNPSFGMSKHGNYEVYTWEDKGKVLFGAFHTPTRIVMGQSKEKVESALDVLDAKADSLKAGSSLTSGASTGLLCYVAGDGLAQLNQAKKAQSPLLNQMDNAWIALGEQDSKLVLHATVQANSPDTAVKMLKSLEGIKAIVNLAADNQNADARAKAFAVVVDSLKVEMKDKTLTIDLQVSLDSIRALGATIGPKAGGDHPDQVKPADAKKGSGL